MRPHAIALGQRALVHGVQHDLGQSVRPPLLPRPLVVGSVLLAQGVNRGLECGAALKVEHAIDDEHGTHLVDVEVALLEVLIHVFQETVGIDHMPRKAGQVVQILDRVLASEGQPHFLVELHSLVTQLLAQVADHGDRLIADLT